MSRTASCVFLAILILGLSLTNSAQVADADTPVPRSTREPAGAPTQTAEAAAVQTIEAALAGEEETAAAPAPIADDFWSFWTPFRVTYRPFALASWAYDDGTIDKWYSLGFAWFLVRLVLAIVALPVDLILIVLLGIGAVLQWLIGETARNIYFGLLALLFLIGLFGGS